MKIIYIAGSGRTGSTFLSMLLSQNADTFNVGQIRDLPKAVKRNPPCSCLKALEDCEFWSKVVADLPNRKILRKIERGLVDFRKDARVAGPWNKAKVRKEMRQAHRPFLKALEVLYQTTAAVAGDKTLVDSSKSPEQAFALSLIGGIELYTINLVRDPRAVTVSWAKRYGDAEGLNDKLKGRAKEWRVRQKLLSQMKENTPDRFKLLRYEDLTDAPRDTITSLLEWTGSESATDNFTGAAQAHVSWDDLHLCPPANEGVLKARAKEISITSADSWKDERHSEIRDIAEAVAFPAATKYGYTL